MRRGISQIQEFQEEVGGEKKDARGSGVLERALDREPQVLALKSQFWLLMWDR